MADSAKAITSIEELVEQFGIHDFNRTLAENGLDSLKTVRFLNAAAKVL